MTEKDTNDVISLNAFKVLEMLRIAFYLLNRFARKVPQTEKLITGKLKYKAIT